MCEHCGFIRGQNKIAFALTIFIEEKGGFGLHIGNDEEGEQDCDFEELVVARDKTSVKRLSHIGKELHDVEALFVDAIIMRKDEEPLVALIYNLVETELILFQQPDIPKPSVN